MLTIRDILQPEHILLECPAKNYSEAIGVIHNRLSKDERIKDAAGFLEAIRKREEQGSTILGNGLAIPHARTETVASMIMGFARIQPPIAEDMSSVQFVFLAGVPAALASDYLRILGAITRIFKNQSDVKALSTISTPSAFIEGLTRMANRIK